LSLDPKIVEAVKTASTEAGQPPALARRIIAWLQAVADESEDINDIAAADRRLELIYEAVTLGPADSDNDSAQDGEED
jgi:hypothetical protein